MNSDGGVLRKAEVRKCNNCKNADRKSDEKMFALGYARCHLLSKSQYVAGWHVCPKWKAKS